MHDDACENFGLDMYSNTRKQKYIHTDIHTYIHTDIHTDIHTYIQTYIHTFGPGLAAPGAAARPSPWDAPPAACSTMAGKWSSTWLTAERWPPGGSWNRDYNGHINRSRF